MAIRYVATGYVADGYVEVIAGQLGALLATVDLRPMLEIGSVDLRASLETAIELQPEMIESEELAA